MKIAIDKIIVSKNNPRQSFNEEGLRRLGESIKTHGQLQAIIVRPRGSQYELVVGERRLRASVLVGLSEIDATVRELDDVMVMELRLIENTQREDLTDAEKGDAVLALWAYDKYETIKDVAKAINISYERVKGEWIPKSRKLSMKVKVGVARHTLTERAAKRLIKYPHTTQNKLAQAIIDYNIRGGRHGAERTFLKLYDASPDRPLEELAKEALENKQIAVPESILTEEQKQNIEEQRQLGKIHRIRKKPNKPLTKPQVRERLKKKTDFIFEKTKVSHGSRTVKPLSSTIKPTIIGSNTVQINQPNWSLCKCSGCSLLGEHCKGRQV